MTIDKSVQLCSRRLTGRIGAEISGMDLADLGEDEVSAIRRELLSHRVVFFREQRIGSVEHLSLASRLGPLTLGHPTLPQLTDDREVFDLDSIAGASANHWHTDVTFVERPPIFSVLGELSSFLTWAATHCGPTRWRRTQTCRRISANSADQLVAVHSKWTRLRAAVDVARLRADQTAPRAARAPAGLRLGGLRD